MKKTTHFAVSRDKQGGYRWKLVGANGEAVATGESYKTRTAMMSAVKKLSVWAATDRIEEASEKPAAKKTSKKA
ncbi:MAG: YegP family protein [Candidatus Moraniibacteriota bacterium]